MIETICCVSGLIIVTVGIIILGIYNRRRNKRNQNDTPIISDGFIFGYTQQEDEK